MAAIVIDASAVVELLLQSPRASAIARITDGKDMVAPDLINVEVVSALRRLERGGMMTGPRAAQAVADMERAPIRCLPTGRLLADIWRLRATVSAYDACYVALADALDCSLVTVDARLAHASGVTVRVILP